MTTYSYTAEFSSDERITLRAALALLREECFAQDTPQDARLRSIAAIEKKLDAGGHQTSGNAFGAGFA